MQKPVLPALTFVLLSLCLHAYAQSSPDATSHPGADATKVEAPQTAQYTDDDGFSFSYPSDWTVIDTKPITPAVKLHAEENASSSMEKQGAACTRLALLLSNAELKARIVVISLPYACVGNVLKQGDLASVASGISAGVKKTFLITYPEYQAYKLNSHEMWIERAQAKPIANPETSLTMETACTMLKKSLVCWIGLAGTEQGLHIMEEGKVTLDGEKPVALVPPTVFKKKQ